MEFQKVILELKNLSMLSRAVLVVAAIVIITIGGVLGYFFTQDYLSNKNKNLTQNNILNSGNYQLSLTKLDSKSVVGKIGRGVKVMYLDKELIEGDLNLVPKEGTRELNFRIEIGGEILNLALPLSEKQVIKVMSGKGSKTETKSIGKYVASKNGKKYHLLTCRYATSIKEENRVYYNSKEEAEADGKESCGVCKP